MSECSAELRALMHQRVSTAIALKDAEAKTRHLERLQRRIQDQILRLCDHDWQPDHEQQLSPYDRRNLKCQRCLETHFMPGY